MALAGLDILGSGQRRREMPQSPMSWISRVSWMPGADRSMQTRWVMRRLEATDDIPGVDRTTA